MYLIICITFIFNTKLTEIRNKYGKISFQPKLQVIYDLIVYKFNILIARLFSFLLRLSLHPRVSVWKGKEEGGEAMTSEKM